MIIKKLFSKTISFLERFIITQLFLSLCTLPFLIWWGLPFSLLTFVGNLCFAPFLSIYLICATLIFFTQLCGIPNTFFISILEYITSFWLFLLAQASPRFLYAAPRPFWLLLVIPPAIAVLLIYFKHSLSKKTFGSIVLVSCIGYFLFLHTLPQKPHSYTLICGKSSITLTQEKNSLHAYETVQSTGKLNMYQWIPYTLCPALAQQFGATKINHWHIPCLTAATSKRARLLATYNLIDTIHVHAIKLPPKEIQLFKTELLKHGCKLIFY